jgi:hypothetical protein
MVHEFRFHPLIRFGVYRHLHNPCPHGESTSIFRFSHSEARIGTPAQVHSRFSSNLSSDVLSMRLRRPEVDENGSGGADGS